LSIGLKPTKSCNFSPCGYEIAVLAEVVRKMKFPNNFNIEVQNKNKHNIEKRSLYYWSRTYTEDLGSGDDSIELVPVIGINIIDFGLGPAQDFHTSYHLWEDRHKDVLLTDVCEIHFLDMVKFRRAGKPDLENPLNRWLAYFDEHRSKDLIEEVIKMDSMIRLTQEKMDQIARDPGLRRAYESIEKAERDRISGMNAVKREAAKAQREAEAAWKQVKIAQKQAEIAQKRDREIVRKLKARGFPAEQIAELTGFSEAEIREW
jgi:predicted transposase/invertase (TIGR01784 family)